MREQIQVEDAARKIATMPSELDPARGLIHLCGIKHARCVIDYTAKSLCASLPHDFLSHSGAVAADLERFVSACPMYHWRTSADIYIVEPRIGVDSPTNVLVGPINDDYSAYSLMQELLHSSRLPARGSHGGYFGTLSAPHNIGRKTQYKIPRDSLKGNLVRAAEQAGPSYWLVKRLDEDEFECIANDDSSAADY